MIGDGVDAVKVGISDNPTRRMGQVGWATAIAYQSDPTDDAAKIERTAHRLLADRHYRGEWFSVSIEDAVAAVRRAFRIVGGQEEDVTVGVKFSAGSKPLDPEKWTPFPFEISVNKVEMALFEAAAKVARKPVDQFAHDAMTHYALQAIKFQCDPVLLPQVTESRMAEAIADEEAEWAENDRIMEEIEMEEWEAEQRAIEEFEAEEALREAEADLAYSGEDE